MCVAYGGCELTLCTSEICGRRSLVLISMSCFRSRHIRLQQTLPCDPGLPLIPKLWLPGLPFLHTPNFPSPPANALHQSFLSPPVYQWECHTLPSKQLVIPCSHVVGGRGETAQGDQSKKMHLKSNIVVASWQRSSAPWKCISSK